MSATAQAGRTLLLLLVVQAFSASAETHRAWDRPELEQLASEAATQHGLPSSLVHALIQVESAWRTDAVSRKGAIGLMQLMPATAERIGVDPHDPVENLVGGVHLLSRLVQRYRRLDLALAAYNAGETAVNRYEGIPPYPETQAYVRKVLSLYGVDPMPVRTVRRIRSYPLMRTM